MKKTIEKYKANSKHNERQLISCESQIKELITQKGTTKKFIEEKARESKQQDNYIKNIREENQLFVGQLVKKGLEDKNTEQKLKEKEQDI